MDKSIGQKGAIPIVVAVFLGISLAFTSIGLVSIQKGRVETGRLDTELSKLIAKDPTYIDQEKLKGAKTTGGVYVFAKTAQGEYLFLKVERGELRGGESPIASLVSLPNGELISQGGSALIPTIVLKDGTKTQGQVLERMVAPFMLADGSVIFVSLRDALVREGALDGVFSGRVIESGYQIAGLVSGSRVDKAYVNISQTYVSPTTLVLSEILRGEILEQTQLSKNVLQAATSAEQEVVEEFPPQGIAINLPGTLALKNNNTGTYQIAGIEETSVDLGLIQELVQTTVQTTIVNVVNQAGEQEIVFRSESLPGLVAVTSEDIVNLTIQAEDIADGAITLAKLADDSVTSAKIKGSAVGESEIAGDAVTEGKLKAVDSPNDEECLTYESTNGDFEWQSCGGGGGGTITSITAGDGLSGGGSSGAVSLSVSLTSSGGTGSTSSNSGLEVSSSGLALLKGCSDGELLKWDDTNALWQCASDSGGGGGGVSTVQEDDATVDSSVTTLDFLGADFALTESPEDEINISIDYTNSKIVRSDQTETISGVWTFSSGLTINSETVTDFSGTGIAISSGSLTATLGTSVSTSEIDANTITLSNIADTLTLDGANLTFASNDATNDYKVVFDNSSTGAITTLLEVTTSGVGSSISTAFDLSDADIGVSLALGSNDVTVGGVTISSSEFALLDSGVLLSELTDSGTLTAGTVDINGGAIDGVTIGVVSAGAGTFTTLTTTGTIDLSSDTGADTITIGQSGTTDDTVTIAGDISLTDDEWSISVSGVVTGLTGTLTGLTAGDLSCTNCIGATEISDLTLGTDTAGNYVASVATSTGLSGGAAGSEGAALTLSVDESTAFAWTGQQSFTKTISATGAVQDINLTLGDDIDVDTVSGINIDATSATTGDADVVYGLNVGNLTSADATVLERAIRVGSGWDNVFDINGTLLSESEVTILDAGIALSELTDSGTLTAGTVDINGGAIDGTTIGGTAAGAGTFTTFTTTGTVDISSDSGADVITIGQSGTTDDTVTIAGDISLTDDNWSISSSGVVSGLSGTLTSLTAGDLSCTNCIGATEVDESTIASTSLSDTGNIAYLNQSETIANDWTFSLSETEDLAIDLSISGTNSGQGAKIILTNSSSSGSQYGLYIDNAASTGTTDALVYLDNSDTDTVITSAIQIANSSRFTNVFDIGGTGLTATEITLLDSGVALSELTDSGTLTAGTVDINGGAIDGTVIGATSRAAGNFTTLDANGNTTLGDTNADTVTINAGSSGSGITFGDTSFANCSALETVSGVLTCGSDDTGAGGGVATLQVDDSNVVTTATVIDFLGTDFDLTNSPAGEGNLSIDYTNSKIVRSDQNESITGAWTFNTDTTLTLAETEDFAINISISGTNSGQGEIITLTNSSSSGNQYGLKIDNAASTGTTEALVYLDNSDTDTVVTSAIQIANSSRFTNIFDIGGTGLTATEITLLDSGIALSELTDSGTLTAGTVDINGGNIDGTTIGGAVAGAGTFTAVTVDSLTVDGTSISSSGVLSLSSASTNAVTLDSGTTGGVNVGTGNNAKTVSIGTGTAGNTVNIGTDNTTSDTITIGSALDNVAITGDSWSITDAGVLTVASCTGCGGGGGSLDTAYNSGGTITVDAYDVLFDLNDGTNDYGVVIDNNTASAIATALEFTNAGGGGFTNEIVLQNGESISNATNNQINLGLGTSGTLLLTSGTAASITNSAGTLTIDSAGDSVLLGSADSLGNGTWSISSAGVGTSLTATDLSCTNCIGATEVDETTIASTSLSDTADIAYLNQSETIANDWTFSLSETEDLAINWSVSGTQAGQGEIITVTNSSSSGNQYGLYLDNAASTGTTESLLVLDNSDTDTAVTSAIQFVIGGGTGFTNLFDVNGTTITSTEFTILDSGVALSELTDSGTLTAGTVDINGGAIDGVTIGGSVAGAGTFTAVTVDSLTVDGTSVTSSGVLSLSSASTNAVTLDSGTTGAVNLGTGNNAKTISIGTGTAGNTINIGTNNTTSDTITIGSALDNVAITGDAWSITDAGVLTVASCTGCGGGGGSLDTAYNSGGTITVDAYDVLFDLNDGTNDYGVVIDNNTASAIATALEFTNAGGGGFTNEIILQNGEAISNVTNNQINLTLGTSGTLLLTSGTAASITNSAGTLTIDSAGDSVLLGSADSLGNGTWSISSAGVGTSLTSTDLSCTNCIGATEVDESTIASTGLSDTADVAYLNQSETVVNDWTFSLAEAEDLAINWSVSGTQAGQGEIITVTNSSSSGNQYGLYVDNAASTGVTESLLVLDNSDTDTVVTNAIQVVIGGGTGFTNLFDVNGTTITISEFTILDSGIALSELTDSGTLTAGTVDINGGAIDGVTIGGAVAGAGTFTAVTVDSLTIDGTSISSSGVLSLSSASTNAVTLDSGTTGGVNVGTGNNAKTISIGTGTAGNTINVGTDNTTLDTINIGSALDNVAITGDDWSITNAGVLTVASCTGCGGGGGSLDTAYNSGGTITVDAYDVLFDLNDGTNDYGVVIDNNTVSAIATALEFTNAGGGGFTNEIVLQNGEAISNATNNQINLTLGTSGTLLLTSGTAASITNSAGTLTIDSAGESVLVGSADSLGNGTWSISSAGVGTSLTATDLSCTNCIGATEVDESTIASTGLSDTADIAYLNQSETIVNDWTFTLAEAEDLAVNWSVSGTQAGQGQVLTVTNSSSSGNQYGLTITNADSTGVSEAGIFIDNADTTAGSLADAILITSSGVSGGIVDGLDASAANIDNAINIGANAIAGTNFSVTGAGAVTAGTYNTNTFTANTLTFPGAGVITGTTTLTLNSTTTNAITIDSGTTGAVNVGTGNNAKTVSIGTGTAGNTINIGTDNTTLDTINIGSALDNVAITGDDWSITNAGVLTVASCTGCGGGGGDWDDITDPNANQILAMAELTTSFDWNTAATAAGFDGLTLTITNDASTDSNTQRVLSLVNSDDAVSTGTTETLLYVNNADANEAVSTGIQFANTGGGGFTVGIDMANLTVVNVGAAGTDFDSSGGLTLASTLTLSNNTLTCTACIDVTDIGANAVDDSELVDSLTYSGALTISGSLTYSGSGRPTRTVTLSPEYPGASLTGDGGSNTGTMTSDFCENGASADIPNTNTGVCNTSGDIHNYYNWTTSQGSVQDYDIWVRWRVPDNFSAWDGTDPIKVWGKRTDTTNNAVTVFVYDTGGTLENASGTQIAGTAWTETAVEASFGGTYTAGSYMTIRIVMAADTGGDSVQVGEISLDYLTTN